MQLPAELIGLMGALGYDWPESDEEKIFTLAGEWTGMADQIADRVESLNAAAMTLLDNNSGTQIDAFKAEWDGPESAVLNLVDTTDPNHKINVGLTIIAGLILALKIQVIVQLAILAFQIAYAIATAPVTFGASLVQIPIFKTITGVILDQLMGMATERLLNG
ncbi:hypothetical protein [Glycomyces buryatensis]